MGNGPVGVSVGIISITLVEVGRPARCGWDCSLGEEDLGLYKQTREAAEVFHAFCFLIVKVCNRKQSLASCLFPNS